MMVRFLFCVVVLFGTVIRDVPGHGHDSQVAKKLSFENPPSAQPNVCDTYKLKTGAPDAHAACYGECLMIKDAINDFHRKYPDNSRVTDLFNKCGFISTGVCELIGTDSGCTQFISDRLGAACVCQTYQVDGTWRGTYLQTCRYGIPLTKALANTGHSLIHLFKPKGKKKTHHSDEEQQHYSHPVTHEGPSNQEHGSGEGKYAMAEKMAKQGFNYLKEHKDQFGGGGKGHGKEKDETGGGGGGLDKFELAKKVIKPGLKYLKKHHKKGGKKGHKEEEGEEEEGEAEEEESESSSGSDDEGGLFGNLSFGD